MRFVTTEQERALIALWRSFTGYQNERFAAHKLLEDPSDADDEFCWFELHAEGSGAVYVKPSNPNQRTFSPVGWSALADAAAAVDATTTRLRKRRLDYEAGRPRFGDPRKGRPRPPRK